MADQALDRLIDLYLADPGSLSLEEQRTIYQHFLGRVSESGPPGRETGMLKKAVETIDRELEQASQGEPSYITTARGTYRKLKAEMEWVPVSRLVMSPDYQNLFRDIEGEDFEQLKCSIQEVGMIEPIIVDQELRVVCGHQRLRAARAIGIGSVPVIVHRLGEDDTRPIMVIEENIRRRHLQPSEMARAIRKLMELKDKRSRAAEVAQEVGLSTRQVNRYRSLDHLIPEISSLLDGGTLTQEMALQIAQLEEAVQRELYQALGDRFIKVMEEQKGVEFETVHADLLKELEHLSSEVNKIKTREEELKAQADELRNRLDVAEIKVGHEVRTKKTLEEGLEKTRAEMYRKVQEKQALIDKLAKEMEPKVVPPPDYQLLKTENATLKATLKELQSSPDTIIAEIHEVFTSRLLVIDLGTLKGDIPPQAKERLKALVPKMEAWIAEIKNLVQGSAHDKKKR